MHADVGIRQNLLPQMTGARATSSTSSTSSMLKSVTQPRSLSQDAAPTRGQCNSVKPCSVLRHIRVVCALGRSCRIGYADFTHTIKYHLSHVSLRSSQVRALQATDLTAEVVLHPNSRERVQHTAHVVQATHRRND